MKLLKPLQELVFGLLAKKGSHIILVKDNIAVPVPKHEEIKRGLLIEII
jgi:predicted RNA binding protein YcfA (HicA-like mRNA interferase family)